MATDRRAEGAASPVRRGPPPGEGGVWRKKRSDADATYKTHYAEFKAKRAALLRAMGTVD